MATRILLAVCLVLAVANAYANDLSLVYAAGIIAPSFAAGFLAMRALLDSCLPY